MIREKEIYRHEKTGIRFEVIYVHPPTYKALEKRVNIFSSGQYPNVFMFKNSKLETIKKIGETLKEIERFVGNL